MNWVKRNIFFVISFSILLFWMLFEIVKTYPIYLSCDTTDPVLFFYIIFGNSSLSFLPLISPIFIVVPAIFNFHQKLHSGFMEYYLTRESYDKYIKKEFRNSIICSVIFPLIIIIFLVIGCILNGNIDFGSGSFLYGYYPSPPVKYISIIWIFMLIYILNIWLQSIFYINVGLIISKKHSSFLITVILSFISFIIMNIIFEVFIGNLLLARILNIHNVTDTLNLFNYWIYDGINNLWLSILFSLLLCVGSLVVFYFTYKNKEGVVIEGEK